MTSIHGEDVINVLSIGKVQQDRVGQINLLIAILVEDEPEVVQVINV